MTSGNCTVFWSCAGVVVACGVILRCLRLPEANPRRCVVSALLLATCLKLHTPNGHSTDISQTLHAPQEWQSLVRVVPAGNVSQQEGVLAWRLLWVDICILLQGLTLPRGADDL